MRDLSKKERLLECVRGGHEDTLKILQMDITDQKSILSVKQNIEEERVDILVCNAGVGLLGPLEILTQDTMQQILNVNLFGTIRTIQAFLPEMKARRSGRIIVTGSLGGLQGFPFNDVYCASKFAVEGLCESLAIQLHHFNIHISLIECGPVNTNFMANQQKTSPKESELQKIDAKTKALYQAYIRHCQRIFQDDMQDTENVVQVFLEAIAAETPALRYYTNTSMPFNKLKLSFQDGSQYIKAASKFLFQDEQLTDL
ncbi:DHB1 dehydrogenase, partial [Polypterus senegalus]|nr:DHB1 dehydrogenase [Polypterus senegalus]